MSMAFMLLLIEFIITWYLMLQLMETLMRLPGDYFKFKIYKAITSPVVSFLINLSISSLLAWFTSGGMIAGFANLGSSILVGLALPPYLRWRYPLSELAARVEEKKLMKKLYKKEKHQQKEAHI